MKPNDYHLILAMSDTEEHTFIPDRDVDEALAIVHRELAHEVNYDARLENAAGEIVETFEG
jgi:hypothetical protein